MSSPAMKQWRCSNRERVRRVRRAWYELNKQREIDNQRRYRKQNADWIDEKRFRLEALSHRLEQRVIDGCELIGLSLIGTSTLRKPDFIFEIHGQRIREYLYASLPEFE